MRYVIDGNLVECPVTGDWRLIHEQGQLAEEVCKACHTDKCTGLNSIFRAMAGQVRLVSQDLDGDSRVVFLVGTQNGEIPPWAT